MAEISSENFVHGPLQDKRKRPSPENCFCDLAVLNWHSSSIQTSSCNCLYELQLHATVIWRPSLCLGCYREKFRNFVACAESDPKIAFFAFLGNPSTILRTAYRKQFFFTAKQWYRWKAETLTVCLLLVLTVWNQWIFLQIFNFCEGHVTTFRHRSGPMSAKYLVTDVWLSRVCVEWNVKLY